jgi:hypothetical protein
MSDKTRASGWPLIVVNVMLVLCGLVMVVAGVVFALQAQSVAAGTCLTGGIILVLIGTIDRFESIKGWGIETKARKLDATINVAEDMLKRLREVTDVFGPVMMRTAATAGRWGGAPSVEDNYVLAMQMRDLLLRFGSSPETVSGMLAPWIKATAHDCFQHVIADYSRFFSEATAQTGIIAYPPVGDPVPEMAERYSQMARSENTVRRRIEGKAPLEAWIVICEEPDRWPFLPEAERAALRARVAEWDPEVRYLLEHADLRTPSKWFRIR